MDAIGLTPASRLTTAKHMLGRYDSDRCPDILQDLDLLAVLKSLDIREVVDLVDSAKKRDGELRSISVYRMWLALEAQPDQAFAAWYNLGVEFNAAGHTSEAAAAFKRALTARADLFDAAINAGLCHEDLNDPEGALRLWGNALQNDATRTALLNHRGRVFEGLRRYDDADRSFLASLLTDPDQADALHHWIGVRTKACMWPIFRDLPHLTPADQLDRTSALTLLALTDDIAAHDRSNSSWLARKLPKGTQRLSPAEGYPHRRLRLGYLSSDYCNHPMAFLVAELFAMHDRDRFEVYGYCSTRDDGSDVRRRVLASFDKAVSILEVSDEEAARAIRSDEIDILIDLNGLTLGSRLPVLRYRPAPVQMTYLGYNGVIPLAELDYILADRYVIPPATAAHHRPKPLYLPTCFQVNDRQVPVASGQTRHSVGLPEDRFVFCCFSNNYKITEEMFSAWSEILVRVDDSVLWLYADNEQSCRNMAERFAASGLGRERLIFAPRSQPEIYRARLGLADLFLDTFPYNAGTTASDALRVGLPIVTRSGRSFVSRMAGSLLQTIGASEGIVETTRDYVELAVALAHDRDRFAALRRSVGAGAWSRTLGDTPRFTRELEEVLSSVAISAYVSPSVPSLRQVA